MKKISQFVLVIVVMLFTTVAFSQSTITGKILGSDFNGPLPGANIIEKGTSNGTTTDFDGNFTLTTQASAGELTITYVGYVTKTVAFNGSQDLGNVTLMSDEFGLDEVMVIASVAVDRKTPVAVSTVKAEEISLKLGTQEFPEVLKSTPGVYATKQGGGYGDGRINLRGFSSENVAVMINGVPVNDMENGRVFWSNWAGLGDVTSTMQVQRGLGAAKVAVPSIGGTINIITKTTDVEAGGSVFTTIGNDGYKKFGITYSTGLMDNGFAATVSAAKTDGDGYVDGTQFNAVSYFVNLSKQINEDHKIALTAFGAKQQHGQRQNRHLIETFRKSARGRKFNSDWGYKNGQVTFQEDNFYHKPQISLNHYWDINENNKLSTAAYVSFGSGGGGGFRGVNKFGLTDAGQPDGVSRYRDGLFGPINFDLISDENEARGVEGSETILRASRNDHKWYGVLSTLQTDISDELVLLSGIDFRYYRGIHFQEVTDLLGGQYYLDDSDVNNPNRQTKVGDKVNYNNDGIVNWLGGFAQAEYSKDNLAAFVSLAASNTGYRRVDFFNYLDSDPLQETGTSNFFGYQIKGGANYNIDSNHNVFANVGYFEKAPFFRAVYPNFNNEDINDDAPNQKITSFEVGYGYRSDKLSANLNVYHTSWDDRTEFQSFQTQDDQLAFANITGVNAIHMGVELDFVYRPWENLRLTGMASVGDWRWENNLVDVPIIDEDQNIIDTTSLFIEDLKVGDAAQTTFALGANYDVGPDTILTLDYNYFADLYADFDPSDRGEVGPQTWKVPAYGIFDAAARHNFKFGNFDATLTARMNNIFDTEYIADAQDGDGSTAQTARVYYGFGRTFSVGARIKF